MIDKTTAIEGLIDKAAAAETALEAMQFAQAAVSAVAAVTSANAQKRQEPGARTFYKADLQKLAERFARAKLPKGVAPDVVPDRDDNTGTNLLTVDQAIDVLGDVLFGEDEKAAADKGS